MPLIHSHPKKSHRLRPETEAHFNIRKSYHIKRRCRRSLLRIRTHLPQLNRARLRLCEFLPIIKDIEISRFQHVRPRMIHRDLRRRITVEKILYSPILICLLRVIIAV